MKKKLKIKSKGEQSEFIIPLLLDFINYNAISNKVHLCLLFIL
mgnify:CR=1 FL=1